MNESSSTALECALRSSKTFFSTQTHLGTNVNFYSSERSIKWPLPQNPRYAKNVIGNADWEAVYHFRVNSYHTLIGRNKIYSFPIQPRHVFKCVVLRSTDLLVYYMALGPCLFCIFRLSKITKNTQLIRSLKTFFELTANLRKSTETAVSISARLACSVVQRVTTKILEQ